MDAKTFLTKAKTLIPDVRAEDITTSDSKGIHEDLGDGWGRFTALWLNPAMVEVHIYYTKPYELKKDRRKSFGVWCYKFAGKDWDINKPYRFWG